MLWVGADVRGPVVDRDYPESATTALQQAAICGDLEVLKRQRSIRQLITLPNFWVSRRVSR
jgi:hypothetical protein